MPDVPPEPQSDAVAPPSDAAGRAQPRVRERARSGVVALGLASVALGVAKVAAPRALARLVGAPDGPRAKWIIQGLGAREVVIGVGLLASRRATPWLWARAAGNALELALLGAAVGARREDRRRAAGALGVLAGMTAFDVACAVASTRALRRRVAAPVRRSVTIARPREEVYRFWRDFANAPAFMSDVESVEVLDDRRSRWSAHGPVGPVVSWEVTVAEDRPDELVRWSSVEGAQSDVRTEGVVRFSDALDGRGTDVELELGYGVPDDAPERAAAFVARAAAPQRIEAGLARGKALLETGRVGGEVERRRGGDGVPG
jgi:uncharacterized membrane protein